LNEWKKIERIRSMPQKLYKTALSLDYDYLVVRTRRRSNELIFQRIKPFPETDVWKRRIAFQNQLRSSKFPTNPASQALLKMLRTEYAVDWKDIRGTFYAIYRYNPFSLLYAPDESIIPGTFGFTTKPLKEGDKLRFVPL